MRLAAWQSTLTPVPLFLLLAACLVVGCAHSGPSGPPDIADLQALLDHNPVAPGEAVRITRLVDSSDMSGILVQVRGSMPPHFHKLTQEVVYLLRGEGILQLGTERMPIKAGAVVRIPVNTVHTFTSQGQAPAVFFVVTTPPWDEQDRFMVQD